MENFRSPARSLTTGSRKRKHLGSTIQYVEAKSTAPLDYLQPGASNGVSSTTYSVPPSIFLIKKKELLNGTKEKIKFKLQVCVVQCQ
jgi:hypothetical protein